MGWLQLTAKMHIMSLEMTQAALRPYGWCREMHGMARGSNPWQEVLQNTSVTAGKPAGIIFAY